MLYFYIFLLVSLLGLIYMYFEASLLEVKKVGFTRSRDCLRVMQLSDIHIDFLRVQPNKVRSVIERERPDLIILSGDYINKRSHIPEFFDFIDKITGFCNIYACLGNHDYKAFLGDEPGLAKFIKGISDRGITVLDNQSVCFEKNSKKYNIIGISDIRYNRDDIGKALKSTEKKKETNIAFSHNPDIVLKMERGCIDYLLCGHFHGGQIWAPFDLEFKLLRNEKLCRMGVKRGLHKVNGINLYINKGLGNVCFPLRFMSRPEITVLYIP